MAEYRVGEAGATVFDAEGRLVAYLAPGCVVVPGPLEDTVAPRTADQEYPMRRSAPRGYSDKVVRPERGPTA